MTSTLADIILEAAKRCAAAFDSTCTALGTTTTLIDAATVDQGTDSNFAAGGWIFRPDAALAADEVRRIAASGYDTSTGTWTVSRAWTNAPASAEAYQVYAILPPLDQAGMTESWKRLVNRALDAIWYEDEVAVGAGDGTQNAVFPLATVEGWAPNSQGVLGVYLRRTLDDGTSTDIDMSRGGRFWKVLPSGGDPLLRLSIAPTTDQDVIVRILRSYPNLSAITDETNCPLTLVSLRTRYELYRHLNAAPQSRGQYTGEEQAAYNDWWAEYRQHRPRGGVIVS